jgi:hypothetical protein
VQKGRVGGYVHNPMRMIEGESDAGIVTSLSPGAMI